MIDPRPLIVGILVTVASIALAPTLPGCASTEEVYVQEPLPLPERPAVPTIPAEALSCLRDDVYADLAERDAALQGHISRLEQIIETTHEAPDE
ncbi:MAG: hypothetical protein ACLFSI_02550 [Halorhodospira sp.]